MELCNGFSKKTQSVGIITDLSRVKKPNASQLGAKLRRVALHRAKKMKIDAPLKFW